MNTEERLAEIRARCWAATPGPWHVCERGFYDECDVTGPEPGAIRGQYAKFADAAFVAAAREDIPFLLVEIDRLMAERDGEQARLRDVVVEAALAERRAEIVYEQMMQSVGRYGKSIWDAETVAACDEATEALQVACDALLAFLGEGKHA